MPINKTDFTVLSNNTLDGLVDNVAEWRRAFFGTMVSTLFQGEIDQQHNEFKYTAIITFLA